MKKLPIEIYLLPIWVIVIAAQLLLMRDGGAVLAAVPGNLAYYSFFGGSFFLIFIMLFDMYLLARILIILTDPLVDGLVEKKWNGFREPARRVGKIVREWIFLSAVLAAFAICAFVSVVALNVNFLGKGTLPAIPAAASDVLMKADRHLFGSYPVLALQQPFGAEPWASILVSAYSLLLPALTFFIFYAIVRHPKMIRKFFLGFFLAQLLALPFWYAFPAVSPYNRYVRNTLEQPPPAFLADEISSYAPSGALATYFHDVQVGQGNDTDVTSFPSMHAAWGAQMGYMGIVEGGLGFVFAPWAIAEMVAAVYNGQHYGVDILAGIFIAALGLLAAEGLLALEKRYYSGKRYSVISDMVQSDYGAVCKWVRALLAGK